MDSDTRTGRPQSRDRFVPHPASIKTVQQSSSPFRATSASSPVRVLIVDDEESIRFALSRYLRSRGFEVVMAESGAAALAHLSQEKFDIMLCDVRMPVLSGLDVLPHALRLDADLGIVMLTAVNDAGTATEALGQGALDYLVKPIELGDLERAVDRAAHRRMLEIERRNVEVMIREEVALRTEELEQEKRFLHTLTMDVANTLINAMEAKDVFLRGHAQRVAELAASVADGLGLDADVVENVRLAGRLHDIGKIGIREEVALRTEELEQEKRALRSLTVSIAQTLINAMEAKDIYLRGHSQRVAELSASVAESMGLDADLVENVRLAGRLHDVGKIGIREEVLNKPGPLTVEEFAHVKDHVRIGLEILAPLKHMPVVLEYVSDHHEHFDGSGYPRGLAGEQITIGGRILAACDAFDALTSRRAFRDAMPAAETVAHLESYVGRLLDPDVFVALKRVVLRRKTLTFIDDRHALHT